MEGGRRHDEERQSLVGQIAAAEAATDRYLTAFENSTIDERTCGPPIRDLTIKLDQLRARGDELGTAEITPKAPSAAAIERLRENLTPQPLRTARRDSGRRSSRPT